MRGPRPSESLRGIYTAPARTFLSIASDPNSKNARAAERILQHRLCTYNVIRLIVEDYQAGKAGDYGHRCSVLPPNTLVGVSGFRVSLEDVAASLRRKGLLPSPSAGSYGSRGRRRRRL